MEAHLVLTSAIQKAIQFSIDTHEVYQKQKRKGKDVPYITHPLIVGLILARATESEAVVIAGILHDTIEDSAYEKKVSRHMIEEHFGAEVANLVVSVTEENKDLPWEERKHDALAHIQTFSHGSVLVKSADTMSNVAELLDDYEREGEKTFSRFNAPKNKIIENYRNIIAALLKKWDESPLAADLRVLDEKLGQIV